MKEGPYLYLLLINLAGFMISAWDKHAARNHGRRVPERKLWLLALAGGSVGLYLSLIIFRHKTKRWSFMVCVPLIIMLQLLITAVMGWLIK